MHSARILLISSDSAILRCSTIVRETNSWHLEVTHSGLEALERVQSAVTPDLVLLDLVPDDSDSLQTLRWLRKMRPRLPIILLSLSNDHERMMEALRLGARDFLIKPCNQQQLDQFLKYHLKYSEADLMSIETEKLTQNLVFVAA